MSILINWLISTAAIILTAYILPGVTVSGFGTALLAALVLGIFNALIRPLLIFFTLPINVLTLGLFTFVINAAIILLVSAVVPQFRVNSFGDALLFAVILALINLAINALIPG